MAMKKTAQTFLFSIIVLFACEEPFSSKNTYLETELIIVEGVITNEKKNHEVSLSRIHLNQNGVAATVTGADVTITSGDSIFTLTEIPIGSGKYLTPPMRAASGKIYKLNFSYNGQTYSAEDSSVPVEPMPDIIVDKQPEGYRMVFEESGQSANYVDHHLDWTATEDCPGDGCEGRIIFYDLKTIDVNNVYKPGKTDLFFPEGTVIVRRKYSVSPAYRDFLRSMLMETEWRGGVFDVERANVPTNLSAGAIGFFAVSTVVTDTTIID
jgi:hypothetical protein